MDIVHPVQSTLLIIDSTLHNRVSAYIFRIGMHFNKTHFYENEKFAFTLSPYTHGLTSYKSWAAPTAGSDHSEVNICSGQAANKLNLISFDREVFALLNCMNFQSKNVCYKSLGRSESDRSRSTPRLVPITGSEQFPIDPVISSRHF